MLGVHCLFEFIGNDGSVPTLNERVPLLAFAALHPPPFVRAGPQVSPELNHCRITRLTLHKMRSRSALPSGMSPSGKAAACKAAIAGSNPAIPSSSYCSTQSGTANGPTEPSYASVLRAERETLVGTARWGAAERRVLPEENSRQVCCRRSEGSATQGRITPARLHHRPRGLS